MAHDFSDLDPAAAAWLAEFNLPTDLKGQTVRVSRLSDQATVSFFFPRRTLPYHFGMVKKLTAALRKRGAKIERVDLTAEVYARWLHAQGKPDSDRERYRFATTPPQI
jgi:hypothetical protein